MNRAQKEALKILESNSNHIVGKKSVSASLIKIPGAGYYDWDRIAIDGDTFYIVATSFDATVNGVFYGRSALLVSKTGTITPEIMAAIDIILNPVTTKWTPQPATMIKCSCGHIVPQIQVMAASMGTSCPDCYDRMS